MGYVIQDADCCCQVVYGPCCNCPFFVELQECTGKSPFMNTVLNITIEAQCGTTVGQLVYVDNGSIPGPQVWQGTLTLFCWHRDGTGAVVCAAVTALISLICSGQFSLTINCSGTPSAPYTSDPPGTSVLSCNPFLFQMTNARPTEFDCCFGNLDNPDFNEHVNITITN
jgi:hypothetical protein